jgi:hypothetical protein
MEHRLARLGGEERGEKRARAVETSMHAVPAAELTAFSFDRISLELHTQNPSRTRTAAKQRREKRAIVKEKIYP